MIQPDLSITSMPSADIFIDSKIPDYGYSEAYNVAWERLLTPDGISLERSSIEIFYDDLSFYWLESVDIDLLYGCYSDGIALAENDYPNWNLSCIAPGPGSIRGIATGEIDLDGDPDPIGFYSNGDLFWNENDSGTF